MREEIAVHLPSPLCKILEKEKFLFLLKNGDSLTVDETEELASLQNQFPYSQAIHNLVAKGAQLNNLEGKQGKLNSAAVYSTDRSVLKAIITAPPAVRKEPTMETIAKFTQEPVPVRELKEKLPASQGAAQSITVTQPQAITHQPKFEPSRLSGDELLDELVRDLDRLKKLKHDFEIAMDSFEKIPPHPDKGERAEPAQEKKRISHNEEIIAEIKSTKRKIKPADPRQKEQLEIIDNFIKSKPSITKNRSAPSGTDSTDLAENSSMFSDNIVSETLVEILIKQGKKEKAIEVLKKLIWKFPQKKAYFAAQIEELTS